MSENRVQLYGPDVSPLTGEYRGMKAGLSDGYTQYVRDDDYQILHDSHAKLVNVLDQAVDFLKHVDWDSHSTEASVGNLLEDARAALEAARKGQP